MKPAIDVGLVVRDFAAVRAFYVEALGLPYLGSVSAGAATVHFVAVGQSLLKIYENAAAARRSVTRDETGLAYITIDLPDLAPVLARLAGAGITPVAPVYDFDARVTLPEPAGQVRVHVAMLADPEGNTVELIERF